MLKRTALALGRSMQECLRACRIAFQPTTTVRSSCSHNEDHGHNTSDKCLLKSVLKRRSTDVTLDTDGARSCGCRTDNLFLKNYMVMAYVAACMGAEKVQFGRHPVYHEPIKSDQFPFSSGPFCHHSPFQAIGRSVHTLRSVPVSLKIHSEPSKIIIPKKKEDNSVIVIREVKPFKNYSFPALDKDFIYYRDLQKVNKIQKDAKTSKKEPDDKGDLETIWINAQFKRQKVTMVKSGSEAKKGEQKIGKECNKNDKKEKKKESIEDICKIRNDCSKLAKKIRAEMFLKMCQARADKLKCTGKNTDDVKEELRKKCKKVVEALKCKKKAEEEKCKKMAEEAKSRKDGQKEYFKQLVEKSKCEKEKLQSQVAELRAMQKACQEFADKIKCAKEAKRMELIQACQALVEKDRCEQWAKEKQKQQRAESKAGGDSCKQIKCGGRPKNKANLEAEQYLREQCKRLAEQNRCMKIRERYKLERRAAELKKKCELVAREQKWRELVKQSNSKKQAGLEKC
ncbi:blast:Axoneme-associated protein mst101(2) [Drosophila guanche]|uniref:Blast:Axoneme-associated protein mst101(2) n=1 Tax=Drosophila guanche TaxID=7266 RepID=A0A3B0JUW0_DROGU|nr:blast:Axoneme-associated protein mst101(2) [Drosophila guanche]